MLSLPDLRDFLQTLQQPWGFGENVVASDKQLDKRIADIRIHVFQVGRDRSSRTHARAHCRGRRSGLCRNRNRRFEVTTPTLG